MDLEDSWNPEAELETALDEAREGDGVFRTSLDGGKIESVKVSRAVVVSNNEEHVAVRKVLGSDHETVSRSEYETLGFVDNEHLGDIDAEFYEGEFRPANLEMPDAEFHIYSLRKETLQMPNYVGDEEILTEIAEAYDQEIGF